jgi:hypothetical protein
MAELLSYEHSTRDYANDGKQFLPHVDFSPLYKTFY